MNCEPELSVVIPVYNEAENLPELLKRILATCDDLHTGYEIVLVDDGSGDASQLLLCQAAEENPGKVVAVILSTNFGQHAAVTAGLEVATGKYIITMDADLQNPPEEIPRLLEKLREGYDVVGSIRENRKDTIFRKLASKLVNRMVRKLCRGRGCEMCNNTGYRGRIGIFELLRVTSDIQSMINKRVPTQAIRDRAIEQGMRTMRADGMIAAMNGITTVDEVMRFTSFA